MTVAFVLSGGASLGAVQVGMLRALFAHEIRPDAVIGTSAGAINASWIAGDPSGERLEDLADIWRSLRRSHVFPTGPIGLLGLLTRRDGLVDPRPLRRLLERHLAFECIEDAAVPLHVVVTDVLTGRDVRLSSGSAVAAVLASAAIPGVFPPVRIGERAYIDGGVVNNAGISHAVEIGANPIFVLPTGWSCSLERPPATALGMALHGLTILVQHRLAEDVDRYSTEVDLRVVPPPCPIRVSPADFSHAASLIEAARQSTEQWLAGGAADGRRRLRPHTHEDA